MSMTLHGCTKISGGAVELSWRLETFDGSPLPMSTCPGTIESIRLSWQVDGTTGSTDFPCGDNHGVTAFDVPAGDALLSVEPTCANGIPAQPRGYVAPAPLERTIAIDDVVELHAVVIELDVTTVCSAPADAAPPDASMPDA